MRSPVLAARLGLAAAVTLLLALGAACSDDPPTPAPSTTTAPSAAPLSTAPAPSTPAPGPTDTAATTQPPPATTPVPPPTPGGVDSTVESKPEVSKKPVKLDKPAKTGTGLTAEITRVKAVEATARLPGEIAGPALAVTVELTNSSEKAADLSAVVVTLLNSDDAPGSEMTTKPADPLSGQLPAGQTERGTYVFTVPENKRNPITVTVSIADAPVLVFTGKAN